MKHKIAIVLSYVLTLKYRVLHSKRVIFGNNFICDFKFKIKGKGKVIIGDNVNMWSFAPHKGTYLFTQSKDAKIIIGDNSRLNGATIFSLSKVVIGKHVLLGTALIQDNDFHNLTTKSSHKSDINAKPIVINNYAWVGGESVILKGVTIGKHSIIGIRSVVRRDIPANKIAFGNPAQIIKDIQGPNQ